MRELVFQVEFLSEIVLPATSNTEGNIEHLDFIPGSNFLGMAAKDYAKYENSFSIFHSGEVRFGDATILSNDKQTYKMPLSIFKEKTDENVIINQIQTPLSSLIQAKQLRNGYITKDKEVSYIAYNYVQKSAYSKEHRRSKDSSMFGYSAIKSQTHWQFTLKYDNISPSDLERIKKNLIGVKRLGKSKSAQYGEVEITLKGSNENIENLSLKDEVVLYLNSRVSLVDEEGNPTYNLTHLCNGLKEENINYEKTQLRTATYTPYNGVRQTKDYERVVINKGSVIVLQNISQEQLDEIKNGVGAYLSEGFGDILINPSFLTNLTCKIKEKEEEEEEQNNKDSKLAPTDQTAIFLQKRKNVKDARLTLANEVHSFIQIHKKIYADKMNSQWGTIRSLCANTKDIHADVDKYISHGIAKDKWEGNKKTILLEAIQKSKNPVEFTKLLSTQMPKVKMNDSKTKDEETTNAN